MKATDWSNRRRPVLHTRLIDGAEKGEKEESDEHQAHVRKVKADRSEKWKQLEK